MLEASTGCVPGKPESYNRLVRKYGVGRVADALLAKWISDDDADQKWEQLAAVVSLADLVLPVPEPSPNPPKYWIVLWYFSMGYSRERIADQLQLSVETIKRDLTYARSRLDMVGAPMPAVVARAIRLGFIP
jgi:DNA-binding NarL/FixJ family response regulator